MGIQMFFRRLINTVSGGALYAGQSFFRDFRLKNHSQRILTLFPGADNRSEDEVIPGIIMNEQIITERAAGIILDISRNQTLTAFRAGQKTFLRVIQRECGKSHLTGKKRLHHIQKIPLS